jgi:hypothetical protein
MAAQNVTVQFMVVAKNQEVNGDGVVEYVSTVQLTTKGSEGQFTSKTTDPAIDAFFTTGTTYNAVITPV